MRSCGTGSIQESIANASGPGAADPQDGIFDSGLSAHPGSKIGVAVVIDAHGDEVVLVRPTRTGDLNLDGQVSISDFIDLATQFNQPGALTWQEGDLNYDGHVTISDFIDLAANFNTSYAPAAVIDSLPSSVPEAGNLGLIISVFCLKRLRRR